MKKQPTKNRLIGWWAAATVPPLVGFGLIDLSQIHSLRIELIGALFFASLGYIAAYLAGASIYRAGQYRHQDKWITIPR